MVFLYVSWNFYREALSYNPMSGLPKKDQANKGIILITPPEFKTGWSKNIMEKNIFSRSRLYIEPKPVVPGPIAPPPPPPKRPELVLKGIIFDIFGDYVAYIEKDRTKSVPVRKGDRLDDVEVIDITVKKVVLKWNAETIELNMDKIKTISKPR
ncbi:MAG: hypothetical protein AB1478_04845 [Nitrospirota bacterium]